MVTCPVLTVTWTTGGFSRCLDSDYMRSENKLAMIRSVLIVYVKYVTEVAFGLYFNLFYVFSELVKSVTS